MRIDAQSAVVLLRAGEVVALPTETVYGLAADADNPLAVRRVFARKGRPQAHPLIVHVHDLATAGLYGALDARAEALASRFWPGPLTLVVPRTGALDEVTGGRPTVALRMPRHPVMREVLQALGRGVAAPSANRFGRISATTAAHVTDELPDVPVVDGGACDLGIESTIVDLSGPDPALLRPGSIDQDALAAVVGPLVHGSATPAPGTHAAHYAPRTALVLSATPDATAAALAEEGRVVAVLRKRPSPDYARMLYAELRRLDALGADVLVAEPAEGDALSEAINDRLRRASHGSGPG